MREQNFAVDVIHSDLTPDERSRAVASFKGGSTRVLIASGILSRGVDVHGLEFLDLFT